MRQPDSVVDPWRGTPGQSLRGTNATGDVVEWVKGDSLGVQVVTIGQAALEAGSDMATWGGTFSLGYNNTERNPPCDIPTPLWNTTEIANSFQRYDQPYRRFHKLFPHGEPHQPTLTWTRPLRWDASAPAVQEALSKDLAGLGGVLVEKVPSPGGGDPPRFLVLVMTRKADTNLLLANSSNLYGGGGAGLEPQAEADYWLSSSGSVLHGNMSLTFPWAFKCREGNGLDGATCAPASTRLLGVCANASEVELALERDLPGVRDVVVNREVQCGIARWNGTILEALHRRCRYEIEFLDVVANASGATAQSEFPWTWTPLNADTDEFTGPAAREASPDRRVETGPDVPTLQVNRTLLRGQGAVVRVREVRKGLSYRAGGVVSLEVTQNGQDFTSDALTFEYRPVASVHTLEPAHGPVYGGTEVLVRGEGFMNSALLACRFGGDSGFDGGSARHRGRHASVVPAAKFFNSSCILCVAPPALRTGEAYVEVSNNGAFGNANFSTTRAAFTYWPRLRIDRVDPPLGPASGNVSVRVIGGPFPAPGSFGAVDGGQGINELRCRFGAVTVVAAWVAPDEVHCYAPPHRAGRFPLEVTANDQDYTDQRVPFFYYQDPVLSRIMPVSGPAIAAGTRVTVFGDGFVNTSLLQCRFGRDLVPGIYVSDHEIACESPPLDEDETTDGSGAMTWTALSEQYTRYSDPSHPRKLGVESRKLFPSAHYYPLYLSQLVAVEVAKETLFLRKKRQLKIWES